MSRHDYDRVVEINLQPLARWIGVALLLFVLIILGAASTYVVQPGFRGVAVTLGTVSPQFRQEGFGLKKPFITRIQSLSVRQQTRPMPAECYSSDLQQVKTEVHVLYRVPEHSVVKVFQQFAGEPFDNLIAPRVQEALKEVTATLSAEMIVKNREQVKNRALELARRKIGTNFLDLVDLVLYNIALSPELEAAIEMKMVQEQEAEKANFTQLKAQIDADTAIIRARGEAQAIQVRGEALRENPEFIKLQILQNWNGRSPLIVGASGSGANLLMSLDELNRRAAVTPPGPNRQAPAVPSVAPRQR
jgi:prohibitin 2